MDIPQHFIVKISTEIEFEILSGTLSKTPGYTFANLFRTANLPRMFVVKNYGKQNEIHEWMNSNAADLGWIAEHQPYCDFPMYESVYELLNCKNCEISAVQADEIL